MGGRGSMSFSAIARKREAELSTRIAKLDEQIAEIDTRAQRLRDKAYEKHMKQRVFANSPSMHERYAQKVADEIVTDFYRNHTNRNRLMRERRKLAGERDQLAAGQLKMF